MKGLLNNFFVWFLIVLYIIFAFLMFAPYLILKLFRLDNSINRFSHWLTSNWGRYIFFVNRSKMNVNGIENLPNHKRIIYIGNHQGFADIPFLMATMPTTIGFIAKKELKKIPVIGLWMTAIHCIFLDRGNFRKAMREVQVGIAEADQGFPIVIFPEGTRSRCEKMAPFKPGSILLAAKAGLTIVPVTINGTYKIYEENKKVTPAEIELTIHPSIDTNDMNEDDKKELSVRLWNIVAGALPNKGV